MREFASQKALIIYAERKGLIYLWEGTPAFARRQRLLSRDQYELAEVRTSRRGRRRQAGAAARCCRRAGGGGRRICLPQKTLWKPGGGGRCPVSRGDGY